jgi:hypothetical protein
MHVFISSRTDYDEESHRNPLSGGELHQNLRRNDYIQADSGTNDQEVQVIQRARTASR